jgi:Flp pilus assembly pilin Flp
LLLTTAKWQRESSSLSFGAKTFPTLKSAMKYQRGVTSIEYALMATLIAIAIVVGVGATGAANAQSWTDWTGKVIAAINGALGP